MLSNYISEEPAGNHTDTYQITDTFTDEHKMEAKDPKNDVCDSGRSSPSLLTKLAQEVEASQEKETPIIPRSSII